MEKKQRDRLVIKALLLSAGVLAVPGGVVGAEGLETSPADKATLVDEELFHVTESAPEESEETSPQSDAAPAAPAKSEAAPEETSAAAVSSPEESAETTAEASSEASPEEASQKSVVLDDRKAQESWDELFEVLEETEESSESEEASEEALEETSEEASEESAEKEAVAAEEVLHIAPPNTVRAAALRDGVFYDAENNLITNRWVQWKENFFFPNAKGLSYARQFISFGQTQYYMDRYGRQHHGVVTLGDKKYLLDERTGILHKDNAWVTQSDGRYFPNAKGELYYNRYITFGANNRHYMLADGREAAGVIETNGKLYLYDDTKGGVLRKDNAWVAYRGKNYFPNAQGELYHDQFISFGRTTSYYMGSDGSRQSGVVKHNNRYYLMDSLTDKLVSEVKPGLNTIDGRDILIDVTNMTATDVTRTYSWESPTMPNADVAATGDRVIGTYHYYMDSAGTKYAGVYSVDGKLYFYDPALGNRRRTTSGKVTWEGRSYFIKRDGTVAQNELVVVNNQPMAANAGGVLTSTDQRLVLDLSYYQDPSKIDFDKLAKNVSGVILRAGFTGYGTGESYYPDKAFQTFYTELKKRGVPLGAYWYANANEVDEGVAEAGEFLKLLRDKTFELPVYWDTEDQYHQAKVSKQVLTDTALAFLNTMEDAGYYVGIYASTSWLNYRLDMSRLKAYDVWVAHYGVAQPTYQGDYGMWQFTSKYSIPGYTGNVDANWMYRDYPSIIKNAGLNGF